jgi:glycerophosphoryl diester phosphodiesterase
LRGVRVKCPENPRAPEEPISTLEEVVERIGGRIGMEIEIKGPEPEAPVLIGGILNRNKTLWPSIEVTSFEPALLVEMRRVCPGIAVDLLTPLSESWMMLDVTAYQAVHRTRLAGAGTVHLHSSQLWPEPVAAIRSHGIGIHAWDINDAKSLEASARLDISRICTDRLRQALEFREKMK